MIISIISLLCGLLFGAIYFLYGFDTLSYLPAISLLLMGLINVFLETRWNIYVIFLEDYNGKKVFKIVKAKKYYVSRKEEEGYYVSIEGFNKAVKYPDKFANLNLSKGFSEVLTFYKEGNKISPCNIKYDLDNITFISDSLIANHYQMMNVVREVVKPPTDTMQTIINIGLVLCMIGCILTMIYTAGKLEVNMEVIDSITEKLDMIFDGINKVFMKLEESVGRVGGLVNNTNIPPVTR